MIKDDNTKLRKKIISLAQKAPISDIGKLIKAEVQAETQTVNFNYEFKCFLEDGAYALHKAVNELQGFSSQQNEGPSGKPPTMLDVNFANGERIKVPYGTLDMPGMGEDGHVRMGYHNDKREFYVQGSCSKRYLPDMDKIMDKVQEFLDNDSIYKGQAIILDSDMKPKFLKLESDIKLFLNEEVDYALTPIMTRILKPNECVEAGMALKMGCLLSGNYGTGKTLLAFDIAKKAIENNWTFIYLKDPKKTKELIEVANKLSSNGNGVILFVEDIDLIMTGERDTRMNEILNNIDGGDTKDKPVISIFTTNHLEKIDPTFMRGKRIGSLIHLSHLSRDTAEEMIMYFLKDKFNANVDLTEVIDLVEEVKIVPAFMAEIIERALSHSVLNNSKVTAQSLIMSIKSFEQQMKIATVKEQSEPSSFEFELQKLLGEAVEKWVMAQ